LLNIETEADKGARFIIRLPQSLSVTRALLVHVGDETYAIPLLGVEGVERVDADTLNQLQQSESQLYKWVGEDYRYLHLGSLLGNTAPSTVEAGRNVPLLLVRSGDFRAAIQVDGLIGSREVVVKPVGPQLSTLRGMSGATIMGDGSVVLIIDLGVLIRLTELQLAEVAEKIEEPVEQEERLPLIMVVDDSITVRKVTTRLLERNEMQVVTAKDGVDALAQLHDVRPDAMLLDIEMPRMDGFELATNIRNDDELKHIPIIMITSRTGDKHRDRAFSIGVNRYMGKPYQEGELISNIKQLLDESET
jgi:chemosensory pili system protein ChpA (sensor histidine kinase/response regulator)